MIKTAPRTHVQFCEHIPFENDGRIIIQSHGKMEVKRVISAITQTLGNSDNPSSLLLQDIIDPYEIMV